VHARSSSTNLLQLASADVAAAATKAATDAYAAAAAAEIALTGTASPSSPPVSPTKPLIPTKSPQPQQSGAKTHHHLRPTKHVASTAPPPPSASSTAAPVATSGRPFRFARPPWQDSGASSEPAASETTTYETGMASDYPTAPALTTTAPLSASSQPNFFIDPLHAQRLKADGTSDITFTAVCCASHT
jgi:hypothetical protein